MVELFCYSPAGQKKADRAEKMGKGTMKHTRVSVIDICL